ncbi:MAG: 30S ribosomal protein S16 [Rickettsiales bacterium]|jgi:small subunit ribosomal protein S16|nr:30S ribosomal protein S16 [Rickettsiales bacterium]
MATKIRFARHGAKKKPFYKLVVTDARSPRNGKFIERIGSYNPMLAKDHKDRFTFDVEKAEKWLSQGAIPSEKAAILFFNNGLKQVEKYLPTGFPKTEEARKEIAQKAKAVEDAAKAIADAKAKEEEDAAKAVADAKAKEEEDAAKAVADAKAKEEEDAAKAATEAKDKEGTDAKTEAPEEVKAKDDTNAEKAADKTEAKA